MRAHSGNPHREPVRSGARGSTLVGVERTGGPTMSVRWSATQYADALRRVVEEAPSGSLLPPDRGAVLAALWARAVEDGVAEQVRFELEGAPGSLGQAVPRRGGT